MTNFLIGQRVTVLRGYQHGPGTIHDVIGGPETFAYRVLMDQRNDNGHRAMSVCYAEDMVLADPIEPYALDQRVTYLSRAATITDMIPASDEEDPRDAVLEISCDVDPPECFGGVVHHYTFVMPAWKLFAYAR